MNEIRDKQFDEERALYNLTDAEVINCTFAGPADGESAFKEAHDISVRECDFYLRYPFWHVGDFKIDDCKMSDTCRAALWYCKNGRIRGSVLGGIKALRECKNIELTACTIDSAEFGWKSSNIKIIDSTIVSEYLLFEGKDITLDNVEMRGKYSFQYIENLTISDSKLDTKDAFWHTKNTTVTNSIVKGEYLGWYSENLTLINCHIIGTQPLCYCKNLKLINCTMEDCDLAFEYSDVEASIIGHVDSIKNPLSGTIKVGSVGEVIRDNPVKTCRGEVIMWDGIGG